MGSRKERHKKLRVPVLIAGGVFLLSLFFITYSLLQIFTTDEAVDVALQEWDTRSKPGNPNELPIPVDNDTALVERKPSELASETANNKPLYEQQPSTGEVIGKVLIPKLKKELPLIEGTDEPELAKGVGHYSKSVMPGEGSNSVIAGHRDGVFRGLGEVEVGDVFILETVAGRFTYEVSKHFIVHKTEVSVLDPTNEGVLTVITCYPFDYIGSAPDRYIIIAKLVNSELS